MRTAHQRRRAPRQDPQPNRQGRRARRKARDAILRLQHPLLLRQPSQLPRLEPAHRNAEEHADQVGDESQRVRRLGEAEGGKDELEGFGEEEDEREGDGGERGHGEDDRFGEEEPGGLDDGALAEGAEIRDMVVDGRGAELEGAGVRLEGRKVVVDDF